MNILRLLLLLLVTILITGCEKPAKQMHEFIKEDIFQIPNITSSNVALYGIELGASIPDVIKVFGNPDNKKEYILEGETNLEYGQNINLSDNGLIFHFDNGTLTRMTIKQPFTEHYPAKTQLNLTKSDVYEQLGLPDKQTTVVDYRVFTYTSKGIDIFLKGRNVNRISFFRKP